MKKIGTRNQLMLPVRERPSEGRVTLPREMQLLLMERCSQIQHPLGITAADGFILRDDRPGAKDWSELMAQLDLPALFAPAVAAAFREDGWRRARHPRAFVRTAAIRIGERKFGMKLHTPKLVHTAAINNLDVDRLELGQRSTYSPSDSSDREFYQAGTTKSIDRGGDRYGPYDWQNLPLRLMRRDSQDGLVPNWAAVGEEMRRAGFTSADISYLILKMQGMTREEILTLAKTEDDRKGFQAAEKSLQRKRRKLVLDVLRPKNGSAPARSKPLPRVKTEWRDRELREQELYNWLRDLYLRNKFAREKAREAKRQPVRPPVRSK